MMYFTYDAYYITPDRYEWRNLHRITFVQ